MTSPVVSKLLPSTETRRAYVHTLSGNAYWIGTFDAYGMRQVACTRIALVLHTRLIQS